MTTYGKHSYGCVYVIYLLFHLKCLIKILLKHSLRVPKQTFFDHCDLQSKKQRSGFCIFGLKCCLNKNVQMDWKCRDLNLFQCCIMKASLFTKTNYITFHFWKVKMMAKIKKSIHVELEAPDQRMLRYGSHINKSKHFWKWHILCNTCQLSSTGFLSFLKVNKFKVSHYVPKKPLHWLTNTTHRCVKGLL